MATCLDPTEKVKLLEQILNMLERPTTNLVTLIEKYSRRKASAHISIISLKHSQDKTTY